MRFLLIALSIFSIGSIVGATYSSRTVENYYGHARNVSVNFAKGENGDPSGWRECLEMENSESTVGLVCEGVRTISVHGGKMADVNYYCEFVFTRKFGHTFNIELERCQ